MPTEMMAMPDLALSGMTMKSMKEAWVSMALRNLAWAMISSAWVIS